MSAENRRNIVAEIPKYCIEESNRRPENIIISLNDVEMKKYGYSVMKKSNHNGVNEIIRLNYSENHQYNIQSEKIPLTENNRCLRISACYWNWRKRYIPY